MLAQGTTQFLNGGPPHIPDNNIIPFFLGSPPPANSDFPSGEQQFPELNLSIPTAFRLASPGVTQAMVKNPNSLLQAALTGQHIKNRTFIQISTRHNPDQGRRHREHGISGRRGQPPGWQRPGRRGRRHLLDRDRGGSQGSLTGFSCSTRSSCSSTSTGSAGLT